MGKNALLSLLLISSSGIAAFEQSPRGARAVALGGATISLEGDCWSSFANPSCLSSLKGTNIAAEYVPGVFGIWEVRQGAISLCSATPVGSFALSITGLGFDSYQELCVGLATACALNERIAIGIGVNLYSLAIRGYGSDETLGLDIGALVRIAPEISYGFTLHNINRPSIGNDREPLPQSMAMGFSLCPIPGALVGLSAVKDSHYPFELSVGVEYSLEDLLTLRLGATHDPSIIACGFGVRTSLFCLDYAYSMHPDLGGTHCLSVSFALSWP